MFAEIDLDNGDTRTVRLIGRPTSRCCRRKLPCWCISIIGLLASYIILIPILYTIAHFIMYPGDSYDEFRSNCELFSFPVNNKSEAPGITCSVNVGHGRSMPAVLF